MSASYERVIKQLSLVASVNPAEAVDICNSHFNFLVAVISSNCESDQEFIEAMAMMAARAIREQIVHRAKLRAQGLLKEEP